MHFYKLFPEIFRKYPDLLKKKLYKVYLSKQSKEVTINRGMFYFVYNRYKTKLRRMLVSTGIVNV